MSEDQNIQLEWQEIKDPNNEFEFHLDWSQITSQYLPEDIQSMIDKKGVQSMVHIVNEHFWVLGLGKPLLLVKQDNKKMVVNS